MIHHSFRKAAILLGFFVLFLPLWREEANVPLFMAIIGLALLGLIVAEVMTGSVARAEVLMLSQRYPQARAEIRGTLFPHLLHQELKKRYFAIRSILAAEEGDHPTAVGFLNQAIERGLRGNRLAFTFVQLITFKNQGLNKARMADIRIKVQQITDSTQDMGELQKKINELLLLESL